MKKINHILIVEDDEMNIAVFEYAVKKNDLTDNLVIRRNGKEALSYLEEQSEKE